MAAEGMSRLSHARRGPRPLPTERTSWRSLPELEKSRRNPGPISLAGFGHVCGIFAQRDLVVEDLEGKSTRRRSMRREKSAASTCQRHSGDHPRRTGLDVAIAQ